MMLDELNELNELNKLLPSVWEPRAPPFQRWPRPWQLRETPQEGLSGKPQFPGESAHGDNHLPAIGRLLMKRAVENTRRS